jgi:hypothetical protein
MAQRCPPGRIFNPVTNRCIPIPSEFRCRNCDEYIHLVHRAWRGQTPPRQYVDRIRNIVVWTLEEFQRRLKMTKYIRRSQAPHAWPFLDRRVERAINEALHSNDIRKLTSICNQIDTWRVDARTLLDRFQGVVDSVDYYIRTGDVDPTYPHGLQIRQSSIHNIHTLNPADPEQRAQLVYQLNQYRNILQHDTRRVAYLQQPIDLD